MMQAQTILQLCAFSSDMEAALRRRGVVVPWFAWSTDEQQRWLADHSDEVGVVVTGGHVGCPNALMAALPRLGLVAINGVGYDKVDLTKARDRGVSVSVTPDVLTEDVADLAIGLIIALLRKLPEADRFVRAGRWIDGNMPLARKVSGRRFGIFGLGRIGMAIAERLTAFGAVAYSDPQEKPVPYQYAADAVALANMCDVLVVACAATPQTQNLISDAVLAALGPDGYLINVSRGSVVDETALAMALDGGRIAGAALDVFADEPNVPSELMRTNRTVLTPHIASGTVETRTAMAAMVLSNVDAFLAGSPLPTPVQV